MNIATAVQTMNEKLGTEVSDAVITYVDEYRDDKLAELRAENRLLIAGLETQIARLDTRMAQNKGELEAQMAQNKGELEAQMAQNKGELEAQIARLDTRIAENAVTTQKEIRSQTRWIIAALFALAGLVIAALKLL